LVEWGLQEVAQRDAGVVGQGGGAGGDIAVEAGGFARLPLRQVLGGLVHGLLGFVCRARAIGSPAKTAGQNQKGGQGEGGTETAATRDGHPSDYGQAMFRVADAVASQGPHGDVKGGDEVGGDEGSGLGIEIAFAVQRGAKAVEVVQAWSFFDGGHLGEEFQ